MPIRVCVAGSTGWAGSAIVKGLLASDKFELVGAVARQHAGEDAGEAIGLPRAEVTISATTDEALQAPTDVLIDYTRPDSVKARTLAALDRGVRVVVGTSGLSAADYAEIERAAIAREVGVIAAGNFSITAALAKHFALIAARYLPSWEVIDYAHADKVRRAERHGARAGGSARGNPAERVGAADRADHRAEGGAEQRSRAGRSTQSGCRAM